MKSMLKMSRLFVLVSAMMVSLALTSCGDCRWVRDCDHSIFDDDCDDDCGYWDCTPSPVASEPIVRVPKMDITIESSRLSSSSSGTLYKIQVRNSGNAPAHNVKSKTTITRSYMPGLGSMTPRVSSADHGTVKDYSAVNFSHSVSESFRNIVVAGSSMYYCSVEVTFTDSEGKSYRVVESAN